MLMKTALHFSHELLEKCVEPGDLVVDATMGNGHDTLLLAKLVGAEGTVLAFDIQEQALTATKKRLTENNALAQVKLFQQGHETVGEVLETFSEPVSAAIFNLGYLPKSDKNLITHGETTLLALNGLLPQLKKGGLILLVIYYGHTGGPEEKVAVLNFCEALPQESYNVMTYQFINQRNAPPVLVAIEKK